MRRFARLSVPLALVASLAAVPPATAAPPATVTGSLSVLQVDPLTAGGSARLLAWVTGTDGVRRTLDLPTALHRDATDLAGERVTVEGRQTSSGSIRVDTLGPSGRAVRYPPPILGAEPWATLLCRFGGDASEPHDVPWFQGLMGSAAPGMDHYWRELSFDQMNLAGSQVFDWEGLPATHAQYFPSGGNFDAGLEAVINDCLSAHNAGVDFSDFVGINMFLNRDPGTPSCDCAIGGVFSAAIDGPTKTFGFTFAGPLGFGDQAVIGQEMGHGFGIFSHSSGPDAADSFPYDSLWDVMSNAGGWSDGSCPVSDPTYGCLAQHTIVFHKDVLGWVPASRLYRPSGGTEQVTLYPLDMLPASGFIGADIASSATRSITAEVRRRQGYDMAIPQTSCVLLHRINTALDERVAQVVDGTPGDGNPNDAGACWQAGETFTDSATGTIVTVDSGPAADGSYLVTITGGTDVPGDEFRPDALIGLDSDRTLRGDNVYNTSGARQTRKVRAFPGERVAFFILTENDGQVTDDLIAHGDGSAPGFRVSYFSEGSRLTSAVVAGNAIARGLDPGEGASLRMEVKIKRSARSGQVQIFELESSSVNDPGAVDVVRAKVKVR